jgi:manganese-transporting P-type ATPase
MITGDNALTACHVARQLRFCRTSTTLILTNTASSSSNGNSSSKWMWQSVDETVQLPLRGPDTLSKKQWREFINSYDMCLTGKEAFAV